MAPTARTDSVPGSVFGDVMHHVVVACGTHACGDIVEVEAMADFPCDNVIGAGSVAADADGAHEFAFGIVKGESAAEDVYAANFFSDHRVVWLAVIGGRTFVGRVRVDRIAMLQAVERTAGLHGRIEVRGGESESWQTESV